MWEVKLYKNKVTGEYKRRIVDSVTGKEKPRKVHDSEITIENIEDAFDYAVEELGKEAILETIKSKVNKEDLKDLLVKIYKDNNLIFGDDSKEEEEK